MADQPFGFSSGDDPEPDKPKKDPESGSGQDPFGFGGGEFDMSQLGQIFSRLGEPLYRVGSCEGLTTTNVAYGGIDNKSLYITESESGCVLVARVPVAGRLMVSHQ